MYDEEIDVADAEEVQSLSNRSPEPEVEDFNDSSRMKVRAELKPKVERPQSAKISSRTPSKARQTPSINSYKRETDDSDASDNSEDDDDDIRGPTIDGAYDPKDYEHLQVSGEIKELFEYITYYTPQVIELDYKLEPFVPDYIPAVGDIDGFLKVGRPDAKEDMLGIAVLDEPSVGQSDPAVLHLRLRAQSKQSSAKQIVVKKLHNAEKNPKAIDKWIHDIGELHKSKPAPTMEYSRPMPDIDTLMQEWPPDFEQKLNEVGLPLEELDVDLLTYVDIIFEIKNQCIK
ncbi:intraflagellar transport 46 isoform X2 [Rhodnius prolixus]|uniref:intraflagellar transport 46 isoform X2 n=1 Tax=Rhodnius prolixus TaxID=13249 RepID=UPI003D188DD4